MPAPRSILIEAHQISVEVPLPHSDHPLVVVDHVSMSVEAGVSYAISGKSGSGKTSLLSVLGLLNSDYTGSLFIDGVDAATLSDRQLSMMRARHIGFVFQSYSLVPHLTALANVLLPCANAGVKRSVGLLRAKQALDEVGLSDRANAKPIQLSGGEQQRVAIARALVNQPQVILADEPTGALDTDTGEAVMQTLVDRVSDMNIALIIVTHDKDIATLCPRRFIMERGALAEDPSSESTPPARHRLVTRVTKEPSHDLGSSPRRALTTRQIV